MPSFYRLQPDKVVGARAVVLFVGTEYVPELMLQTFERMRLERSSRRKKIIWLIFTSKTTKYHRQTFSIVVYDDELKFHE